MDFKQVWLPWEQEKTGNEHILALSKQPCKKIICLYTCFDGRIYSIQFVLINTLSTQLYCLVLGVLSLIKFIPLLLSLACNLLIISVIKHCLELGFIVMERTILQLYNEHTLTWSPMQQRLNDKSKCNLLKCPRGCHIV